MMPLGLTAPQLVAYHERLVLPHDFRVEVDVLDLDENHRSALEADFIDGQIDLERNPLGVSRTTTLTVHDPGHTLHLDDNSPFQGGLHFNRIIRPRHIVEMPWGLVTAIPSCGVLTKVTRDGSNLLLTTSDKAILAMEGRPPMKRAKGYNAVKAIRDFMEATGERRFRFQVPPAKRKRRLHKPYAIGWTNPPWKVCQEIAADVLDMQLIYSCDGALLLRNDPDKAAVTYDYVDLIGGARLDYDSTTVRNNVRVTGQLPKKKGEPKPKKFTEVAVAKASNAMSQGNRSRNGAPGYLPLVIEDLGIHKHETAKARANKELAKSLPLVVEATWTAVPFFHLDSGDRIKVIADIGDFQTPLLQGSIPLGLSGDASLGKKAVVSKPQRTGRRAAK